MVLGIAAVAAVRLAAPQSAPPLYDSFVVPSPYIYLHPSPGQPGNPDRATLTRPSTGADVGALVLATHENPPQAQLLIAAASLAVPAGAHSITASITPVDTPAVPPQQPRGAVVTGNTYRFRIVTDGGADVPLVAGHPATLVLRGPSGVGAATVEQFDGTSWTALTTTPIAGPDIFAANTTRLGEAALVVLPPPTATTPPGSRFGWLPWVAGIAAAVIALAVPLGLMLARRRRERR